jgi:hypothetical protein
MPKTPEQVAPPKVVPSHFSVPSIKLFPHLAGQLLSLIKLHLVGQHLSLFVQEVIELYTHLLFEQLSLVQESLSSHWGTNVQDLQSDIAVCEQILFEQLSFVHILLSLH